VEVALAVTLCPHSVYLHNYKILTVLFAHTHIAPPTITSSPPREYTHYLEEKKKERKKGRKEERKVQKKERQKTQKTQKAKKETKEHKEQKV
jgi:hypothetical protein